MGAAYFIVVKDKPRDFDASVSGKPTARAAARLASVARELGVTQLEAYVSMSDLYGLLGLDEDEARQPPQELVAGLSLQRQPGYLYFLSENKVLRKKQGVQRPPAPVELVTECDFVREEGWLYFLNE